MSTFQGSLLTVRPHILYLRAILVASVLSIRLLTSIDTLFAQSINPVILFDQLSTQVVTAGQPIVVPVGATALMSGCQLNMTLSGLPGASISYTTDPAHPGRRIAGNLNWTAPSVGSHAAELTVVDLRTGYRNTTTVEFVATASSSNWGTLIIDPIEFQQVILGHTLSLPISVSRPSLGSNQTGNMALRVTDSDGTLVPVAIQNSTTQRVGGILNWQAPNTRGLHLFHIEAYDSQGSSVEQWLPVFVSETGTSNINLEPVSAQVLNSSTAVQIPVGATSTSATGQLDIISIAGLPGASIVRITGSSLGRRVAASIRWTPPNEFRSYTASITFADRWSNSIVTQKFSVVVNPLVQ